MKIDHDSAQPVERPDEGDEKADGRHKEAERDDFGKLLEEKKTGESEKEQKARKHRNSKTASSREVKAQRALARGGEFEEKVRDGRLQKNEQRERRDLVERDRHTSRSREEKRLDGDKSERHFRKIGESHREEQTRRAGSRRGGPETQRPEAAPKGRGRPPAGEGRADWQPGDGRVEARQSQRPAAAGADRAGRAGRMQSAEAREQMARLAHQLVEKAHLGCDAEGRRIMLLDLQVPERGSVRVRLRRRGDGFEVRMRADNDDLARELRRGREAFREAASEKGVEFTNVQVV